MIALLKIRNKNGQLVRLRANRAQREFSKRCGRRNIVLKARQMGITTWIAARFFVSTITRVGTLTVLVAHDQAAAEEIFRIVHRFWENLPGWLRKGALMTSRANVRQLVFPSLDSEYRVETAADPDAGRGLTIQNLHASEVARWPRDAAATLASLRAAVAPAGEIVLESTPRGTSGCFYQEWRQSAETGATQHFFPWWWEPAYRKDGAKLGDLLEEEVMLMEGHGLDAGQIAYRRELKANFRGLAKQEFAEDAETCFLASDECFFESALVEERLRRCTELELPLDERKKLHEMAPPQPGRTYIMGVDSAAGGAGGDYSCAQVIDRGTAMQVAELHGHFSPPEMSRKVVELAHRYNTALVVVENNGVGGTVLSHLLNTERYPNLYHCRGTPGFSTTMVSRPALLDHFAGVFAAEPELVRSVRLLREMRSFIRQRHGRPEANAGAHDDCVMAMALALKVREESGGHRGHLAEVQMTSIFS